SFDDYSGFNSYLSDKLNSAFAASPSHKNIADEFAYKVALDSEGVPEIITLSKRLQTEDINKYLEMVIKDIPFYFPSLDEQGQPIPRSEEHTSELQSRENLVCRLLLEK